MAGGRRKTAPSPSKSGGEKEDAVKEDPVIVLDESSTESEVEKLRGRWELASVLNFLNVFEPVLGSDLKWTAEEIETGLIEPNSSNAQLHIKLLKSISPGSKLLNGSDAWVTVLCKKLAMWWPWVAEGEIPLSAANGEEISRYKELDPTCRLLLLKALCEIRADQDDTVSYINDALKNGTPISSFRKERIGRDEKGTSYWYDGNTITGYRLYREVNKAGLKSKLKGKECLTLPANYFQWETIATNLEEFRKVADELSSSKFVAEVTVGKTIANDAVPNVEKFQKKKERSLKRKQRQEMLLLNGFNNTYVAGITRSCRSRRPISYTFEEYDRVIDDAIATTKKRKTSREQKLEKKHIENGKTASTNGDSVMGTNSKDSSDEGDSTDSDTESDRPKEVDDDGEDNDNDYDAKKEEEDDDDDNGNSSNSNNSDEERNNVQKPVGSRWSERLAGGSGHPVAETRNGGTKNRLRQRPTRNSALDSADSDDEKSSDGTNSGMSGDSGHGNLSTVAESEEEAADSEEEGSDS